MNELFDTSCHCQHCSNVFIECVKYMRMIVTTMLSASTAAIAAASAAASTAAIAAASAAANALAGPKTPKPHTYQNISKQICKRYVRNKN